MKKELLDELGIKEGEFSKLAKKADWLSEKALYVNLSAIKRKFGLSGEQLGNVARRLDIVVSRDNIKKLGELQERLGFSNEAFQKICEGSLDKLSLDVEFYEAVKERCGLTSDEILQLVTYSALSTRNITADKIEENMTGFTNFGITRSQICNRSYNLMYYPSSAAVRITFASLCGFDPSSVLAVSGNVPNDVFCSRVLAEESGLVEKGHIGAKSAASYQKLTGVSDEDLTKLVPVSKREIVRAEQLFREKYPQFNNAFKSLGQNLIQFADFDESTIKSSSADFVSANRLLLKEKLRFSDDEIDKLYAGKEWVLEIDPNLFLHNLLFINRLVAYTSFKTVVSAYPDLLANASTKLIHLFKHLMDKYDMTVAEFALIVVEGRTLASLTPEAIDNRANFLKSKFGFTDYECGRLFARVFTIFTIPEDYLSEKIESAMAFGFTQRDLAMSELLSMNKGAIEYKVMLAMLNGMSKEEIIEPRICRVNPTCAYARRMARENGELDPEVSIYASNRFYKGVGRPIPDEYFEQKYPFDLTAKEQVKRAFAKEFPEIREAFNLLRMRSLEDSEFGVVVASSDYIEADGV